MFFFNDLEFVPEVKHKHEAIVGARDRYTQVADITLT